jgi:eukaryotic-like serine/threonine-protein kinase
MTPLAPGLLVGGRYRLDRMMASGSMGSVWAGWHTRLDVPVAVKFMDPRLADRPAARDRFEREAKAAAHLRSPHVVQVLDYGVEDDRPFIVMELLEGEDLHTRLHGTGRLSLAVASRVLNQCCKALRLAADAGIVHRDLKPSNIFITKSGEDEVVKILDFGVAKALIPGSMGGGVTQTGVLIGSPHFMSPEQVRGGKHVDHRSDLWSMGIILFHLLTGRNPFGGEQLGNVLLRICTAPVPKPSELVPDLPPSVDDFFVRALERDPELRFQSAREMAARFQAIVAQHLGIPESELSSGSLADAPGPRPPAVPAPSSTLSLAPETSPLAVPVARSALPFVTKASAPSATDEIATLPDRPAAEAPRATMPTTELPQAVPAGSTGAPLAADVAAAELGDRGTLSSTAGTVDESRAIPRARRWRWLGAGLALAALCVAAGLLVPRSAVDAPSAGGAASAPDIAAPASSELGSAAPGASESSAPGPSPSEPGAASPSSAASASAAHTTRPPAGASHSPKAHRPGSASSTPPHPIFGI